MSVFDNRTLNEEEKRNLKIAVEDTVEAMRQIDDLNNHIKENNKGICDSLNENVSVPEQKIKPSMIKKMAKARLKEEYLAKAKDELNETEEALVVVYGEGVSWWNLQKTRRKISLTEWRMSTRRQMC